MAADKQQVQIPSYLRISKVVLWALYFFIIIGIISMVFNIFLLLFSANSSAGFYKFVMQVSESYLQPFRGIFPPHPVSDTGYLNVSALFAIVVYLFILWGAHSLISYVQNKIDISRAEQEKQLAEIKRQRQLASLNAQKVVERAAITSKQPRRTV